MTVNKKFYNDKKSRFEILFRAYYEQTKRFIFINFNCLLKYKIQNKVYLMLKNFWVNNKLLFNRV